MRRKKSFSKITVAVTLSIQVNSIPASPDHKGPSSRAAQLRKMGILILLAGLLIAGFIYAFFSDNAPTDENSLKTQYYKRDEQGAQGLWGGGGSLVLGVTRALRRPDTYSVITLVIAVVMALACFFLASRQPQKK